MDLNLLSVVGDAFWIVAMALIASSARTAWRRVADDVRVPVQWRLDREPRWRSAKKPAFFAAIAAPLAFGLILSAMAREPRLLPSEQLLVFLARAATAPLFVLIHYAWLRAALRTLASEGALKP